MNEATSQKILWSQPARAVWIEMQTSPDYQFQTGGSQPARAVWIEIFGQEGLGYAIIGHSLRGLCGLK